MEGAVHHLGIYDIALLIDFVDGPCLYVDNSAYAWARCTQLLDGVYGGPWRSILWRIRENYHITTGRKI
jgi:hypothetical protein